MPTLEIDERFTAPAPVDQVFSLLLDAERIVTCLPGATLLEVENPRSFVGSVKVKVGPVTVGYKGRIRLTEVDEAARTIKMVGEGAEQGGSGSARMTMDGSVVAAAGGGSEVRMKSSVNLVGRIVQLGRGMIKNVGEQIFKQFAGNVQKLLAAEVAEAAAPAAEQAAPQAATGGQPAEGEAAAAAAPAEKGAGETAAAAPAPAPAAKPAPAKPKAIVVAKEAEPIRILPLILKAMFAPFVRFFRRLFGRGEKKGDVA